MPVNPFDNPLLLDVAVRIGGLLVIALVLVAALERKPWTELKETTLFVRIKSWAIIAPLFVLSVFAGGFVVFLLAAFIGIQGSREYSGLTGLQRRYARFLFAWVLASLLVAALARKYFLFLPLAFFATTTLLPIVTAEVEGAHRNVTGAVFGYLYIGLPMAFLVFIKGAESWGLNFLLIVGTAVALSDVLAFVVGSLLKGPKLAPKVSPGKTWSGVLGNFIGAGAGLWLMSVAIPPTWSGAGVAALAVTVAVGAIWGDLTESFVKRDFAVKDTGDLIPGFGGMLDRVDSLLLAMPLGYYALLIANRLAS